MTAASHPNPTDPTDCRLVRGCIGAKGHGGPCVTKVERLTDELADARYEIDRLRAELVAVRAELDGLNLAHELMAVQFRTMQAEKEQGWREADKQETRAEAAEDRAAGLLTALALMRESWDAQERDLAAVRAERDEARTETVKAEQQNELIEVEVGRKLRDADRRIAAAEAELAATPKLWSCPDCAFTFDAVHTNTDGSGLSCPVCELAAAKAAALKEAADAAESMVPGTDNMRAGPFAKDLAKWLRARALSVTPETDDDAHEPHPHACNCNVEGLRSHADWCASLCPVVTPETKES